MVSQACQRQECQDWAELWLCVKKFSDRLTLPALLKTRVGALTVNITRCELKIYAAPSSGRKRKLSFTVLGPCYYLHEECKSDLIS
jgi:hypothetical protein